MDMLPAAVQELVETTPTHVLVGVALIPLVLLWLLPPLMRSSKAPPSHNAFLPLLNAIGFASHPVNFITKLHAKYGSVFTAPFGPVNLTFLIGPEASAPFYKARDEQLGQAEVYGFMTPVFGKDVVYDAPLVKRQHQIKHTAQALRSRRLAQYVPKIVRETSQFVAKWQDGQLLDALEELSVLTIMTASRCLHGDEVRENMFEEVSRLYHDLDKGITPVSFFWPRAPTAAHARRDAARREMVALFTKALEARAALSEAEQAEKTDLLQVYMDMSYKDGSKNTPHHVTGMLIALLFAGQHTSSITSTWVVLYLAHNPEIQERVRDEVKRALADAESTGGEGSGISYEALENMELLASCIKEVLRLHPPLIMLMRKALKPVPVLDKVIPKGDIVVTSPAVSHRVPEVFAKPDAFDPDRFMPGREEHKVKPFSFMGFGGGIHACIGQQFGMMQVKSIVTYLLLNYRFEKVDPIPECNYEAMVVGPKEGARVRVKVL